MSKKPEVIEDPQFAGMDAALKRAAKAALALARKTKTPCSIWQDGGIVDLAAVSKRKKSSQNGGSSLAE
jgi:hypothetical protein